MVWEQRCPVVVVLSSHDEGTFWPLEGYELHPLVVSGVWSYDALRVSREEARSAGVIFGLEKIKFTLQSIFADESSKLCVQLLHYPDWPQNGSNDHLKHVTTFLLAYFNKVHLCSHFRHTSRCNIFHPCAVSGNECMATKGSKHRKCCNT